MTVATHCPGISACRRTRLGVRITDLAAVDDRIPAGLRAHAYAKAGTLVVAIHCSGISAGSCARLGILVTYLSAIDDPISAGFRAYASSEIITLVITLFIAGMIIYGQARFCIGIAHLIGFDDVVTADTWRFIKNDLKTYADSWDSQKNSILKQSSQKDPVIIKNIPMVGRIDGFKDNKGWVAGCAAAYFGVNEFIVE